MPPTPAPPHTGRRARRAPLLVVALAGTVAVVLAALWFGRRADAPRGSYASGPAAAKRRARPQRRALRNSAAAAIAVGGYIHLCLYRNGFRAVPKIGTGFLIQVVTSAILAGALLVGR